MTVKDILGLIEEDNSLMVENEKIRELGIDAAIVYAAIKCKADGSKDFFAYSVNDLEHDACVNGKKQKKIIDNLSERGYVSVSYKDIPKHRYIKILK